MPAQPDKSGEEPKKSGTSQQQISDQQEPPAFSSAYHKAHKNYGLFSALLIAWELIGIEIPEVPLEGVKIAFKSPQAVPYVLLALVVYFSLKYIIEWLQSNTERRKLLASRVEFWVSHSIGGIAILIYAYQATSQIQVADLPPPNRVQFVMWFFGTLMVSAGSRSLIVEKHLRPGRPILVVTVGLILLVTSMYFYGANIMLLLFTIPLVPISAIITMAKRKSQGAKT